jgi:hypothetical protein
MQVEQIETVQQPSPVDLEQPKRVTFKKIRGGFLFVLGYLLSPLSFWNDLFFNLPVAYGFGYLCSLGSQELLLPCTIAGYWLSNVAGILFMQFGAIEVFQDQPKEQNLKKQLLMGAASSTVCTLIILALAHFKILDTSAIFADGKLISLDSLLHWHF